MLLLRCRRQASISEFRSRLYVDVREYYDKVGAPHTCLGQQSPRAMTPVLALVPHCTTWHFGMAFRLLQCLSFWCAACLRCLLSVPAVRVGNWRPARRVCP
jgi:hypothetical protein